MINSYLAKLEALWLSLHHHHAEVAPHLGAIRTESESWASRSREYRGWLSGDLSFIVVAEEESQLLAYACVRLRENKSATWHVDERAGEIETLSVLPAYRGQGIGQQLLNFVTAELRRRGVKRATLDVIASNEAALRFYRSQEFEPTTISMTLKIA